MTILNSVEELLENGGGILWLILFVSIYLWSLICERLIFLTFVFPTMQVQWQVQWKKSSHSNYRLTFYIKKCILSEAKISMERSVSVIKMLIAICPMLGLLGTVLGMMQVFDSMAVIGNGNTRSMAAGISQATISTMAGMVIAISGLYFYKLIEKNIQEKLRQLAVLLQ